MLTKKRQANPRVRPAGKATGVKKQTSKQQSRKTKKNLIKSNEAYELVMKEVDTLMKKGEKNLSDKELVRLRNLSVAAEQYEDINDPLPLPDSLPDLIRMRMFQMQLNQGFAAELLGVSDTKFSLIMNGRQRPDVNFLKAVHSKLQVDANKILQAI